MKFEEACRYRAPRHVIEAANRVLDEAARRLLAEQVEAAEGRSRSASARSLDPGSRDQGQAAKPGRRNVTPSSAIGTQRS